MKNYLAVFTLPKPQREHAKIVEVIRGASNGDFKQFPVAGGIAFLFCSVLDPYQITFDKILMNQDSMLVVEIGSKYHHQNLGSAAGWLGTHTKK